jgi:NAD(P)-dependent dehydrogenase (short-subunit alcohol dehydrogenase family)
VIAVTGSAGGIGAAVRARLERDGGRVIGVDVRDADVVADLSNPEGRAAAAVAVEEAADGELQHLVLCAGLGGTVSPTSLVARVNYFGAVDLLDRLRAALARADDPAVVVIGSNSVTFFADHEHELLDLLLAGDEDAAADLADRTGGETVYGMSKVALTRSVRARAGEWGAAGIRLNVVAPGPVRTPLLQAGLDHPESGPAIRGLPVPLERWGEPADVAEAVAFLLGPTASWIHGSVLFVDGGTDALVRPDRI